MQENKDNRNTINFQQFNTQFSTGPISVQQIQLVQQIQQTLILNHNIFVWLIKTMSHTIVCNITCVIILVTVGRVFY